MHAEGFVKKTVTGEFKYVFQHKDHLGNIRMNYTDINGNGSISASEILEEHNYYAFGGKHLGYNNVVIDMYDRKFNGVEQEKTFGINLYEMDFRQYDVAIGRFIAIDPVTHFSMSTYTAFDNNPVFWSDPSGADGDDYDYELDRDFDRDNEPDRRGDFIGDTEWDDNGDAFVWNGDSWDRVENEIVVDLGIVGSNNDERNDFLGERDDIDQDAQDYPELTNNYNRDIGFKPDYDITIDGVSYSNKGAYTLCAGEKIRIPIDGVNVNGTVHKVTNGYESVIIDETGRVGVDGYSVIDRLIYVLIGGEIERDDINDDDDGWDALFNWKE